MQRNKTYWKTSLPRALTIALGKEYSFAESLGLSSRQSIHICRELGPQLSATNSYLPRATVKALGKDLFSVTAAVTLWSYSPSCCFFLPWVRLAPRAALGKAGFADTSFAESSLPRAALGKDFAERSRPFAESPRLSANMGFPVVRGDAKHDANIRIQLVTRKEFRKPCGKVKLLRKD